MASQYDAEVALNSAVRANPAPWLGLMRARQNRLEDEARADARTQSLLEAKLRFEERQGELNRKNRLEAIEAQAEAYTKRLDKSQKQTAVNKLIADGFEIDTNKSIDDQLIEGLKKRAAGDSPKIRGAVSIHKSYEKRLDDLNDRLVNAQMEDEKFIDKSALALAQLDAAHSLPLDKSEAAILGETPTLDSIKKASKIPEKRRRELAAQYESAIAAAMPVKRVALLSSQIRRPTSDTVARLAREQADLKNKFSAFESSEPGRLAADRMAFEAGTTPAAPGSATAATAAEDLSPLSSAEAFLSGAGEDLGQDFREPQQPVAAAVAAPRVPLAQRAAAKPPADLGFGPSRFFQPAGNVLSGIAGRMRRQMAGVPQVNEQVAQIFGTDAPELLTEAAKLSESNGISPEQQQATFDAALSGDTAAQEQISTVLNYMRQAKRSQAGASFQPTFDPGSLFPTNSIDQFTPSVPDNRPYFAPAR